MDQRDLVSKTIKLKKIINKNSLILYIFMGKINWKNADF